MWSLRRFVLLAAVAAGSCVLAGPAFGAFARPAGMPKTLGSTHFLVHYQSDLLSSAGWAITQTQAGDVAARAERAYAAELADGYPPPLSDGVLGGDGRIDIYVADLGGLALGLSEWDADVPAQTSGFILLAGERPELGLDQHTIAHELFHLVQFGIWRPSQVSDYWLLEGSAEWMGYRVDGYGASHPFSFGPSDLSLDCRDPAGTNMCDLSDSYVNGGYSRWPFFEYLIEKYGSSFVTDVFAQGAAGAGSALAALSNALAAKGTTLADTYNAWTTIETAGAYSVNALQTLKPVPYATVPTGTASGPLSVPPIDVNHLSTRYVKFTRGDGDASHACYVATLSLSVAIPAGTLSKPAFYWDTQGSSPVQLAVSGNTASASIPWDTCTYPSNNGYLSLPNASTNVDAADFVVSASLQVDTTQPTTPTAPPDPVPVTTPVVPVTNADVAPTLELFGPEILKLSATQRQLRLIVESTGQGAVRARLGSADLGKVAVRGGANDVRFKLPKSVLVSLRRSAAASSVLTLTPVSASGAATGQPVTRKVRIVPAK